MKVSKIQQLLLKQDSHDKLYHADIYYQSTNYKLKHFALHFSKYFARYSLGIRQEECIINTLLIGLSYINTLKCSVPDIDLVNGRSTDTAIKDRFAYIVLDIAKALDSLDHVESHPSREQLESVAVHILLLVESYIHINSITDFETKLLLQYQKIADKRLA